MEKETDNITPAQLLTSIVIVSLTSFALLSWYRLRSSNKIIKNSANSANLKNQENGKNDQKKGKDEKIRISLYFGSQTGTAEGFAKDVAEEIAKFGYDPTVRDLEDFEPEDFVEESYCMFFTATYGEGDPPDNAMEFHSWLTKVTGEEKEAEDIDLSGMKFAVFGLGNKQYDNYNAMGKFVNKSLLALGANMLYKYGEGNDDDDIEEDFEAWKEGLIKEMKREVLRINPDAEIDLNENDGLKKKSKQVKFKYSGRFIDEPIHWSDTEKFLRGKFNNGNKLSAADLKKVDFSAKPYFECVPLTISAKSELRKSPGEDTFGSTLHLEFDLTSAPPGSISYETADNLAILPENDDETVNATAELLGLTDCLQKYIKITHTKNPKDFGPFPTPCTLFVALKCYIGLNQFPTRQVLNKLSTFAANKAHRERLLFLSSKEGSSDFHRLILEREVDLMEVFEMFPSIGKDTILKDLGGFFEILPKLQPRYYTISSSNLVHPKSIHVTASVLTHLKPNPNNISTKRIFKGVCTHLLQRCKPQFQVFAFVRKSTFKLPFTSQIVSTSRINGVVSHSKKVKLLLIGPGTGLAPMRAFLQEISYLTSNNILRKHNMVIECKLFFGCRRRNEDFIYETELLNFQTENICELFLAFSRENLKSNSSEVKRHEKIYVQDLILREKEMIWNLLETKEFSEKEESYVFVCGGTEMGKQVEKTLKDIVRQKSGKVDMIEDMIKQKRYVQELWTS